MASYGKPLCPNTYPWLDFLDFPKNLSGNANKLSLTPMSVVETFESIVTERALTNQAC